MWKDVKELDVACSTSQYRSWLLCREGRRQQAQISENHGSQRNRLRWDEEIIRYLMICALYSAVATFHITRSVIDY